MMSSIIFNIPYLLYFIPLLASIFMYFIDAKRFLITTTYLVIGILFCLSSVLLFNVTSDTIIVDSTTKYNVIGTEFKINFFNVFILVMIFFVNLISFLNYIKEIIFKRTNNIYYIKNFFSIFCLCLFSIVGIIFTDNIFHLFLFLELYSFCLYMMMVNYNNKNLLIISYKYFSSNIFGSILSMFSIFYMLIYFDTNSLLSIKQQLVLLSLKDNIEIFLIFLLLILSIVIKFFNTNTSRLLNTDYVGINFISITNLFTNTLIGLYLLSNFTLYLFPINTITSMFYIDKIAIILTSIVIIYNSYILINKNYIKATFNVFTRTNLIGVSYIIMTIFFNNSDYLILHHIIHFLSISLILYYFSEYITIKYNTNKLDILNVNAKIKYFFIAVLLYILFLPLGTSLTTNKDFIIYAVKNNIYVLIPYLLNKIAFGMLIYRIFKNDIEIKPECIRRNRKLNNITITIISTILFMFILSFI